MLNRLSILISRLIDVAVDPDVENKLLIEFKDSMPQRPKKSELSGWQLPTRKNFPGGVRKSFSRQKKTRKSFSR